MLRLLSTCYTRVAGSHYNYHASRAAAAATSKFITDKQQVRPRADVRCPLARLIARISIPMHIFIVRLPLYLMAAAALFSSSTVVSLFLHFCWVYLQLEQNASHRMQDTTGRPVYTRMRTEVTKQLINNQSY